MRYQILATSLSLALAGGAALADEGKTAQPSQQTKSADTSMSQTQPVDLLFDTDSASLKADATADLQDLATWARCHKDAAVILEGHADQTGPKDYNVKLSARRAAEVRAKLIAMGVPSERIIVTVYGENAPPRATLAENRRVTVRPAEKPVTAGELPQAL